MKIKFKGRNTHEGQTGGERPVLYASCRVGFKVRKDGSASRRGSA